MGSLRRAAAMTTNPPPVSVAASDTGRSTLSGQTLTTFDWLDSRIEEAAARSDLLAAHHLAPGAETAFAPTTVLTMGEEAGRVLGQVVLGYSPVIDRYQGVIA